MDISNRVVIITGGASGLGAATARAAAARGAKVVLADIRDGEDLAKELGGIFVKCDVTSEDDAKAVVVAATALGELRGLVNCAGVATGEKVVGREGASGLKKFAWTVQINLIGTYNLINQVAAAMQALPAMADGERGVMINTASVAAFDGQIGQAAYGASKAGVVGMTLPIARAAVRDCRQHDPQLTGLAGGAIDTFCAIGRVMPTTPALDAPYAACPIWPSNAATDAVLIITPRSPSAIAGSACIAAAT